MFDRVPMGQVCVCQIVNGTGLFLTELQWERFVFDRRAMGHVSFDRMAMRQVCV